MSAEKLVTRAVTPMEQHFYGGCFPTSVSMVLSGFGINVSEEILVNRYFPQIITHSGVMMQDTVVSMVTILKDMDLQSSLQLDVFVPYLWRHTNSLKKRYIIKSTPEAIRKYGKMGVGIETEFDRNLRELLEENEIGVYTANAAMMKYPIERGFYEELAYFVRKGHIIGPKTGKVDHVRVLDGTKTTEKVFWVIDPIPNVGSYPILHDSLLYIETIERRGDTFDYLFRVSPKEGMLNVQLYGIRSFLQNLRKLMPK